MKGQYPTARLIKKAAKKAAEREVKDKKLMWDILNGTEEKRAVRGGLKRNRKK